MSGLQALLLRSVCQGSSTIPLQGPSLVLLVWLASCLLKGSGQRPSNFGVLSERPYSRKMLSCCAPPRCLNFIAHVIATQLVRPKLHHSKPPLYQSSCDLFGATFGSRIR